MFLAASLVGLIASPAFASTSVVTSTVDEDDAGACASPAVTSGPGPGGELSLREAICEARNQGTGSVTVPAGTYLLSLGALVVGGDLDPVEITIAGAGATATIIDGGLTDRVFNLDPTERGDVHVTITGLTVRNGKPHDGYGGGGILAGAPEAGSRDSLTLSNCRVTGNVNDTSLTRTNSPGGGVAMAGGSLTVTNCVFSGNSAGSSAGGGIYFSAQRATEDLAITDSTFTGNLVTNASAAGPGAVVTGGGALALVADVPGGAMTVADSTFTSNAVTGADASADARGGAIYLQSGTPTLSRNSFTANTATGTGGALGQGGALYATGSATLQYARIVGNTASGGGNGVYHAGGGTVTASRNWWGCNAGPGNSGCDSTGNSTGVLTVTPRLQFGIAASPTNVATAGTATVTAGFLTDSAAVAVPGNQLTAFVGMPVTWAATLGALSANQNTVQSGGAATATFTGGVAGGVGSARATVDGQLQSAAITVDTPPAVTTQPVNQTVTAGLSATFTASASGSPTPTVQWQVSTNAGGAWSDVAGATSLTLTFTAGQPQNGNWYRAVFTNTASSATSDAVTLTVGTGPAMTAQPDNATVNAGQTATFTAAASGTPTPTVQWQVSTNGGGVWADVPSATSATLSFTASAGQGGNQYRAVFTNGVGPVTSNAATLTVRTAPVVTTPPADQSVTAGQPATFTAAASGSPAPTVLWEVSTNGGDTWSAISGETTTTLTFTGAVGQSGNRYRAVFTNLAGVVPTAAVTLTVATVPVVTTQPGNQTATAGHTATFVAAASGSPAPTVQWQVSTDGGAWADLSGATAATLAFATTAGQGGNWYQAVFTNPAGSVTSGTATLTVRVAPPPPTGGVPTVSGPGSVSVAWSPPGGSVDSYLVYVATSAGGPFSLVQAGTCAGSPTASPCLATGLAPGTPYFFRISAVAGGVESEPVSIGGVTVAAAAVSPTIGTVTPGTGSATVTWTPPSPATGITGYTATAAPSGLHCDASGADATSCTISGLPDGVAQTITVIAHSPAGDSTSSGATEATPSVPPGVPPVTAVGDVSSLNISWDAPDPGSGIVGYTAVASPGPATCEATAAERSCVLGAVVGTTYTVTVVAHGRYGRDTASLPSAEVTPIEPTPPATPPETELILATVGHVTEAAPGEQIIVYGSGFAPYSTVTVTIYSAPLLLASVTTGGEGSFRMAVTVPAGLAAGKHTFLALGVDPDGLTRALKLSVFVAAVGAALPPTGDDIKTLVLTAVSLLMVALACVVRVGRRQRV